jgi:hypothetical protein
MTRSVLTGTTALESFGFAVAGVGDVDGNGYGDFAVGAPSASPSMRRLAGAVTIYLGSAAGFSASRVVEGPVLDTYFGWSVAGLGDLDGDGFTDVGIGSPLATQGGRQYCGAVTVFRGGRGGVAATPQRVLFGGAANDRFGTTLGGGGDLDGDGFADVLAGAFQASPMGRELAGAVAVFAGSAAGLAETPQRVLVGANRSDGFGSALSGAMDVNRDGFADAVIGVNGADPGGRSGAGAASVYLGDAGGLGAAPQRVLEGAAALDALGRAIACGVSPRRRHPRRDG